MVHSSRIGRILATLVAGMFSFCANAQAQSFSSPKAISSNLDFSMTPQVAVDGSGNINVVWEEDTTTANIYFGRSTDGGMNFSVKPLSNPAGDSFNPRICVDAKGAINVVWLDDSSGNPVVNFSRSTDGGANFSGPVELSSEAAYSSLPQVGVDGAGNISVVWESDSSPVGILYRHSTDGSAFSQAFNLATNPVNLKLTGSVGPQMAIGVDGSINVVWEDDFNFQSDISFSRSVDGANFSATLNLSNNAGNSSGAQIAVDLSGNINVAWEDNSPGNNDILFTRSTDKGATFSGVTNISQGVGGDSGNAQVAVDGSGHIFVTWQDNVPNVFNKDIYFAASTDGKTFSNPPQNLSQNSGNSISPSMAVDATGAINIGWQDNTPGKANAFVARSTDGGASFTLPASQNLSNDSGASSDVQVVTDSKGNVDVVWADNAFGANQIFFSADPLPDTQPPSPPPPPPANHAPVANAGPDQTLQCAGHGGSLATLDGSASSDPDGDTLSYVWTDEANHQVGSTAMPQVSVGLGTHTFTLTATDPGGLSSQATTRVTVTDTVSPTLSVSLSPNSLWPPNHKLVKITATIQASDACCGKPTVQLVSITSSDENSSNDIQAVAGGAVAFGTDVRCFLLRAERANSGVPRVYTVTYRAKDASGNATLASAQVWVGDPTSTLSLNLNQNHHKKDKKHDDDDRKHDRR